MKKLTTAMGALAFMATSAMADGPVVLNAVGTWSSLTNFQRHEEPFFNQRLNEASGGEIVGKIQSQSGLGLKGFEIMRLVKTASLISPSACRAMWPQKTRSLKARICLR